MPYELTNEGDFLFLRLFGALTNRDLMQITEEAKALEDSLPIGMDRVIDFTAVEGFDVGFPEIFQVAQRRKAARFQRSVKCAVIARQPIEVGFARMFQTLSDNSQIEVRIVRSLQGAKDWFAEK